MSEQRKPMSTESAIELALDALDYEIEGRNESAVFGVWSTEQDGIDHREGIALRDQAQAVLKGLRAEYAEYLEQARELDLLRASLGTMEEDFAERRSDVAEVLQWILAGTGELPSWYAPEHRHVNARLPDGTLLAYDTLRTTIEFDDGTGWREAEEHTYE